MNTSVKTHRNLTTTFSVEFLGRLEEMTKDLGVQKNDIITEAVNQFYKKRKQKLLAESYKKMSGNKDLIALADEGLNDWDKTIGI